MRRYAERWSGHRRDAEKVNDVGAAKGDIGVLDDIGQFAFGQPWPQAVAQRGHAAVGQSGADPQPVDFFSRFDLPQLHIAAIEIGDSAEARRQRGVLLECHRPDHPDPSGARAAAFQHRDRRGDRGAAAPTYLGRGGEPPRQRHMIDVLNEHGIGNVRCQHADRLGRHRPAGQPLHRRAEPIGPAIDQVIEFEFGKQRLDRAAAPRHFSRAKARIVGVQGRAQTRRQCQIPRRSSGLVCCSIDHHAGQNKGMGLANPFC